MTDQRDFKKLVRARMAQTGERYAAARAQVLKARSVPSAGPRSGGCQGDVGALRNALNATGLQEEKGEPLSEATVFGLCGGVGFLYAVFEYQGHPPMLTIVARSNSMPGPFLAEGLARSGVEYELFETGGAKTAQKQLDEAVESGDLVLCHVDIAGLPYHGASPEMAGAGPAVVGVLGFEEDGKVVLVDDRPAQPMRVLRTDFDEARAINKQSKHRLVRITSREERVLGEDVWRGALSRCVSAYDESPAKSFQSNIGTAGLRKWAKLLVDEKDKKGWPTVFTSGAEAYVGLRRVYDCLEHDYTGPAGGRPLFAEFLAKAQKRLKLPALKPVVAAFERSGSLLTEVTTSIAGHADKALREGCRLSDERARLLDEARTDELVRLVDPMTELYSERRKLAESCAITETAARELYAEISGRVAEVAEVESDALQALSRAIER